MTYLSDFAISMVFSSEFLEIMIILKKKKYEYMWIFAVQTHVVPGPTQRISEYQLTQRIKYKMTENYPKALFINWHISCNIDQCLWTEIKSL
jgi:hypothetical protein